MGAQRGKNKIPIRILISAVMYNEVSFTETEKICGEIGFHGGKQG